MKTSVLAQSPTALGGITLSSQNDTFYLKELTISV